MTVPPPLTLEERLLEYKPGSIRRIKLKNFLTYNEVEFRPGARLNVVIGPNGTGKSTILCAICLGLGGQPPLLGRADDARLFIMHEKDIAEIEIEIAPFPDKETHVLRRVIDRNKGATGKRSRGIAASSYYINDREVKVDEIRSLVSDVYNIAIDNLCTFLPQDRVGSFSGFDSKQLLLETEKSVSASGLLYDQHMKLIELEEQMLSSDSHVISVQEEVRKLEADVSRLKHQKDMMEDRNEAMKQLDLIKKKLLWTEFDLAREEGIRLKEEKKQKKLELQNAQSNQQPIKDEIAKIQHLASKISQRKTVLQKQLDSLNRDHDKTIKRAEKHNEEIESDMSDLNSMSALIRRAQEEVTVKRRNLEHAESLLKEFPPAEEIDAAITEAQEEFKIEKRRHNEAKTKVQDLQFKLKEKQSELQSVTKRYEKMQDDRAIRNQKIFATDGPLQQTSEWVKQNKNLFRRPVHGPIVCEISTKDNNAADFLEQHVRNAVLKSFVVECKEDYNLLYREVRQKRKMRINIQLVEQGKLAPINRLYSERMMGSLKADHGVHGYLDECFDAPDAVMQALRSTSNVHSVLVGSAKTGESIYRRNLGDLLSKRDDGSLRSYCVFYPYQGRKEKVTAACSRYVKKMYSSTDEIGRAKMLSPGVPPEEKEMTAQKIETLKQELERLYPLVKEADDAFENTQKSAQSSNAKLNDARLARTQLRDTQNKVERAKRQLDQAEKDANKDDTSEKRKLSMSIRSNTENWLKYLSSAADIFDETLKTSAALAGIKMSSEGFESKIRLLKEQLYDMQTQTQNLERAYARADEDFKRIKKQVSDLKDAADKEAPLTDDKGNDTPLRALLDDLPTDKTELEQKKEDLEDKITSILDNPKALEEYEEKSLKLEAEKANLESLRGSKEAKRDELKAISTPWQTKLTNIVSEVNNKFEKYMQELGCAGEVRIKKGDTQEGEGLGNFKDWGVQIRVKFREKSDLQVLSAQVHSGGERSVSTILYLMAMQDMMVSPFRCVDEINQGLDERNERLVFKRIVENSTKKPEQDDDPTSHGGQYFLITPKLLPNLTDMENDEVTILCIFNGPYNLKNSSDWDAANFIRYLNQSKDDEGIASPNKRQRTL